MNLKPLFCSARLTTMTERKADSRFEVVVVPHFSSEIVERAKCDAVEREKNFSLSPPRVAFSRVEWFSRARVSLALQWGTSRSLLLKKKRGAQSVQTLRSSDSILSCSNKIKVTRRKKSKSRRNQSQRTPETIMNHAWLWLSCHLKRKELKWYFG